MRLGVNVTQNIHNIYVKKLIFSNNALTKIARKSIISINILNIYEMTKMIGGQLNGKNLQAIDGTCW